MLNDLEAAFKEIAEERSLPREVVLEALQTALVSAYRRDAGASSAQLVEARIDPGSGPPRIFVEKEVVDDVMNESTEVTLEKARFYDPEAQLGDMVMVQVEGSTKRFGRIAAQTAKQVILQKIREAERNSLYEEYIGRQGDIVSATVQSVSSNVTVSLGRTEAILPRNQQIPREKYRQHDKIRVYIMEVKRTTRGPQIVVSRSHRNMLRRLLEYEVPELYNGQIEIKNIAREAGYRSKVAVAALQEGIDPVGACVGMRGIRIQNIVRELHEEKIDVIEWNPNQEQFIAKALSPAQVTGVYLDDDPDTGRTAVVVVPDEQLSLAIGREGQNARLAAKLTGWRIDIKSVTEAVQWGLDNLDYPALLPLQEKYGELVGVAQDILQKKQENRTIMPEEYKNLAKLADIIERHLQTEREAIRQKRLEEINAVKATLPQEAFEIPVDQLELSDELIEALKSMENAGELMLAFLIDEKRIHRLLADFKSGDVLPKIQDALDKIVFPDVTVIEETDVEEPADEEPVAEVETEAVVEDAPVVEAEAEEEAVVAEESLVAEAEQEITDDADVVRDAFGGVIVEEDEAEEAETEPVAEDEQSEKVESADDFDEYYDDFDEYDDEYGDGKKQKKKARQKRRQLIYDEERGKVVAKRRRKGSRKRDDWEDY